MRDDVFDDSEPEPAIKEPPAFVRRFRAWRERSKPNEFDKPTRQEWTLAIGAILFAPVLIAVVSVWIFFQDVFLELPRGQRVLFALAVPVLMPVVCCYAIPAELVFPLFKRIRLRARMLKEAEGAVKELVENAP